MKDAFDALLKAVAPRLPPCYRDYPARLADALGHINQHMPQLKAGGLRVLDVGPGVGAFMVAARQLGNDVYGIEQGEPPACLDSEVASAHRGFLDAYRQVCRASGLTIDYRGFHAFMEGGGSIPGGPFDVIHFEKSLDGILLRFAHRAAAICDLVALCLSWLADAGVIVIWHNANPDLPGIQAELSSAASARGARVEHRHPLIFVRKS